LSGRGDNMDEEQQRIQFFLLFLVFVFVAIFFVGMWWGTHSATKPTEAVQEPYGNAEVLVNAGFISPIFELKYPARISEDNQFISSLEDRIQFSLVNLGTDENVEQYVVVMPIVIDGLELHEVTDSRTFVIPADAIQEVINVLTTFDNMVSKNREIQSNSGDQEEYDQSS